MNVVNRRRFERFSVQPMYTPVIVRVQGIDGPELHGHAYDVSEGGVRFELDEPVPPGTAVSIRIKLPGFDRAGSEQGVLVLANIVWVNLDDDEPGPVRMAAAFSRFPVAGDRERLLGQLSSGRYSRAA